MRHLLRIFYLVPARNEAQHSEDLALRCAGTPPDVLPDPVLKHRQADGRGERHAGAWSTGQPPPEASIGWTWRRCLTASRCQGGKSDRRRWRSVEPTNGGNPVGSTAHQGRRIVWMPFAEPIWA